MIIDHRYYRINVCQLLFSLDLILALLRALDEIKGLKEASTFDILHTAIHRKNHFDSHRIDVLVCQNLLFIFMNLFYSC